MTPNMLLGMMTDSGLILIAFRLTVAARLGFREFSAYMDGPHVFVRFAVVILAWVLSLYYCGLYDFRLISKRREILVRLMQACGAVFLALSFAYYLYPELSVGRGISVLASPILLALMFGWPWMIAPRPSQHWGDQG